VPQQIRVDSLKRSTKLNILRSNESNPTLFLAVFSFWASGEISVANRSERKLASLQQLALSQKARAPGIHLLSGKTETREPDFRL
jgi:hypothetical protein